MQQKFIDLTGRVFGRLTVIDRDTKIKNRTHWNCVCVCGKTKSVRSSHLTDGKITSCGCYNIEATKKRNIIHGQAKDNKLSPEYTAWRAMKQRCNSKSYHARHRYSERGIKVCKRWQNSFANFLKDMGKKPTPKHTLDRYPNKDGDYKPSNCRWATMKEQNNNRCDNKKYNAKKITIHN